MKRLRWIYLNSVFEMTPKLRYILKDKGPEFINIFGDKLSTYVIQTFLQVLQCGTGKLGYQSYFCVECRTVKRIRFTCKKRFCPSCSQWANRKFALSFVQRMLPVTHRHITFTIPKSLWHIVHNDPQMQKLLIQRAYLTVKHTMDIFLGGDVIPGAVNVLHNFGRELKRNCHVHMIVTEGGLKDGRWVKFTYFPFEKRGKVYTTINEIWQDNVLEMLRETLPKTENNRRFIDGIKIRYPNGFYVHGPTESRIKTNKSAYNRAKYITRYVRHPPISDNRIQSYDGQTVTFWYQKPSTGKQHFVSLPVLEFINRVVMHLPEKGFHIITRYGLYSTKYVPKADIQNVFTQDGKIVDPKELTWRETMIHQNGWDPLVCKCCCREMVHVCTVFKRRDKFKVKYHLFVDDLIAINYPDDEQWL